MFNVFKKGKYDFIIAGLGNPGPKYDNTRHNAGFMVIDALAKELGVQISKNKFHALIGDGEISGHRCMLVKPLTFMNNSGESIRDISSFYKISAPNIIIISDDISLDVGRIRIRRNGSAGGHNGLKSIFELTGTTDYPRIKVGVGNKPSPDYDLVKHVLGKFSKEEQALLNTAIDNACGALNLMVNGEIDKAMNLYN